MKDLDYLLKTYEQKKDEIKKRLREFKEVLNESDESIFAELAFCICTPQSKATACWDAVSSLMKNNLLYIGSLKQVRPFLNVVRFGDKKADNIIKAREFFKTNDKFNIKYTLLSSEPIALREWLVKNITGIGMKEASHFLRNVGLGENLAILDRHILKNLKEYGVIKKIPKNLTEKIYLDIENKMKGFSGKIGISLDELDLLFWSKETGKIFK